MPGHLTNAQLFLILSTLMQIRYASSYEMQIARHHTRLSDTASEYTLTVNVSSFCCASSALGRTQCTSVILDSDRAHRHSATHMDAGCGWNLQVPPHTGTTVVAVAYDGGVVLGADSRVSTGTYVSNRASDKLTPLSDFVWLLRSGSAADTQAIADYVRFFTHQHSLELTGEPSVKTIATLVKSMNYQYKQLLGAMIVAGWDKDTGGQVYGCPIGGTLVQENWTTDGSGSTYIWGYLDATFREGMSRQEAEDMVKEALALAMSRDGSSGGVIRLCTINAEGVERKMFQGPDIPTFWDELPTSAEVGMVVG